MLAFFGKSEKVLAPRKKERERVKKQRTESMDIGQWCTVVDNEWTIETLVETLNGKMGGGKKKLQNSKISLTFRKKYCLICLTLYVRGKKRQRKEKRENIYGRWIKTKKSIWHSFIGSDGQSSGFDISFSDSTFLTGEPYCNDNGIVANLCPMGKFCSTFCSEFQ